MLLIMVSSVTSNKGSVLKFVFSYHSLKSITKLSSSRTSEPENPPNSMSKLQIYTLCGSVRLKGTVVYLSILNFSFVSPCITTFSGKCSRHFYRYRV